MDATTTLIVGAVLVLVYLIMAAIFTRLLRHPILLVGVLLMLPFFVIFGTLILLLDGLRLLLKPVLQPFQRRIMQERRNYLQHFTLPASCIDRLRHYFPSLTPADCSAVEQGLHQFFMANLDSGNKPLAMPSVVVGQLWQEWSLLPEYNDFCQLAVGRYLPYRAPEWQAPGRINRPMQAIWHQLCKQEQIKPNAPERLPRLFALDAELNIKGGLFYTLTAQETSQLKRQMRSSGSSDSASSSSGKARGWLAALMIMPVGALAMSPAVVQTSLLEQYFAWLVQTFPPLSQQQDEESLSAQLADELGGELAGNVTESALESMLDGAGSAASGFDWSCLFDCFSF